MKAQTVSGIRAVPVANRPAANRRRFRIPRLRTALAALMLLPITGLQAHSVEHEVARAETVLVTFRAGPDQPFAAADYRIYRPDGGEPFTSGITDRNGRIAFRPDRAGTWRVVVSDASGHGASIRVDVDEAMGPAGPTGGSGPRLPMVLAGIGYLLGAAGVFVLLKARH